MDRHVSTVVFSVCGLAFWKFCVALVLGLPKQLISVYVGGESDAADHGRDCD